MKRAACILIIEKGFVLAASRKDNLNDWGLVGGKCEEGESFEDAAARECFEETNIRAYDLHFVFERRDKGYVVKTFMPEKYYGKILSDEEQAAKKEGRVKWATPQELMEGSFGKYNKILFQEIGIIK
jgi:8-oxo-dGTP pyrophosphatase MutT (NUDIX family)